MKKYGNKSVEFKGSYDNKNMNSVYENIDVLVVPSVWYEVSPLVIQEAFLAGIPVITTDIGGMAELVDDGIDGYKFSINDWDSLEKIMLYIANDPTVLNKLKISRDKVVSIEEHAEFISSLFQEVIKNDKSANSHERAVEGHLWKLTPIYATFTA